MKTFEEIKQLHEQVLYGTVRVRTDKAGGSGTVLYSKKNTNNVVECVSADTPVLCSDLTWKKAGDLELGDGLFSFDESSMGHGRQTKEAKVTHNKIKKSKVMAIYLKNKDILYATPEHPWLTGKSKENLGWSTTSQLLYSLQHGIKPHLRHFIEPWDVNKTYESGFLAGAYDGEGCWRLKGRGTSLYFTQKENELYNTICTYLDLYKFPYSSHKKSNGCRYIQLTGGLKEQLRFLGSVRPKRLLAKLEQAGLNILGRFQAATEVEIEHIEDAGERDISVLSTSTGTHITGGYPSHNTYVLTNHHVVSDAIEVKKVWDARLGRDIKKDIRATVSVEFFKYNNFSHCVGSFGVEGDIVAYIPEEDMALLKLRDEERLAEYVAKTLPQDKIKTIHVFDEVYACGAAMGHPPIPTKGFITHMDDEIENFKYWMSNAQTIFGNSGGAIYRRNEDGIYEFIGVPSRVTMSIIGFSANPITHMGYFIPIDRIYRFLKVNQYQFIYDPLYTPEQCHVEREREKERERFKLEHEIGTCEEDGTDCRCK